MSDNPTVKERLASIETSLDILIKVNNKDHKRNNTNHAEIKNSINDLRTKVNEELSSVSNRLGKVEKNSVRIKTETTIYKKLSIFILGAVSLGISSFFFSVVLPKLLGI